MRDVHHVIIGVSWGTLPASLQIEWTQLSCDRILRGDVQPQPQLRAPNAKPSQELAAFELDYNARLSDALKERRVTPSRRIHRPEGSQQLVVAVCASTTSRGIHSIRQLEQLTLFSIMLPSLVRTLADGATRDVDAASGGTGLPFELWVYIAFDGGDVFYDNPRQEEVIRAWLNEKVVQPLAAKGLSAKHCLLKFDNVLRKPGPSFNFMMASAAEDGADYLYRVNDDTQFVSPWLADAVRTLRGYSPPNVGVVGPTCHEGNTRILTHDLVHRTHLTIFEHYYPPVLSDWWMDDWITRVYSESGRMRRGAFLVRHRVDIHGTRYQVDQSHEVALIGELARGRRALDKYLEKSRHAA